MSAGIPLTDADRAPWLAVLNRQLTSTLEADRHPILACSALKEKYRCQLLDGLEGIPVLFLRGSYENIRSRLLAREGHYMKENLLQSQFEALEEPGDGLTLDISMSLHDMLDKILGRYPGLQRS
jgi:gluconokinase